MNSTWLGPCHHILWFGLRQLCQVCKEAWQCLKHWILLSAIVIKCIFSLLQAVRRLRSPTLSLLPGLPMQSLRPAPRAAWAAVAVTRRNRVSTTRRRAGSGAAALQTSTTAWASPRCLWMRGRLSKTPGLSWIYITMKWDARYVCVILKFYL